MERILIIGANGQIGSELVEELSRKHGNENIIAADIGVKAALAFNVMKHWTCWIKAI